MPGRNIIPIYDLYKMLESGQDFEFKKLEESYNPYDASSPHRHNYYEMLFFNESGGLHEIDFNSFFIEKNSVHFISPEQVHILKREKHVSGFVVSFTKEFYFEETGSCIFIESMPFFDNPLAMPVIRLDESYFKKEILDILLKIRTEYFNDEGEKEVMLRSYLSLLLIALKRKHIPEAVTKNSHLQRSELTYKFKKLVEKNFRQNKSVSEYAKMLNITAGHLNDKVQNDTGKTAGEIIHERIILEAKRMLYHSPKSIKEIAFELLYDDPSYFVRFFKTNTRLTPEQFRNQIREKYH